MIAQYRCCGKVTFLTETQAAFRLREIIFVAKQEKWETYPVRYYQCSRKHYHLTSYSEEFASRWELYRQERIQRLQLTQAHQDDLPNPVMRAIQVVLRRDDHRCVVCGDTSAVTTITRGLASDVVQVKRMPPELRDSMRRLLLSNVITVCAIHAEMLQSQDFGWPWGWRLEKHHDPERFPLLYQDDWVYLTNKGEVIKTFDRGPGENK